MEHVDISTDEIHISHNYVYADATAREAASLTSSDIGKIAKQTDNKSFWVLADNTGPIWVRISAGAVVNAQTGTTYTVLAKDRGKLVTHTNAAAIAVTLPQASSTGFGADWFYWAQNRGAGLVTITPTTSTIDGASSIILAQNEGVLIVSDGTNYFTMRGRPDISQPFATLTDGATITWDFGGARWKNATVTLGGNRTLAFSNVPAGATGTLKVVQDATGSRTLTLPAGSKVINTGGGAIVLSTGANKIDILTFVYDGTNYFWNYGKDYS